MAEDVDPEAFDDLPTTGIEVERHVHYGMTGSFPLRMAEMFFADDGLYIAEYSYITPMFGLATRKHRREAASMERVFEIHGIDEVLLQADSVVWHSYDNLGEVVEQKLRLGGVEAGVDLADLALGGGGVGVFDD
ncbi:hypothetical protein BRC83_00235 [Halobacteriales archaeon QS_1_68_17]|nr:MAG: hypothetical protein BRC83_00235 [Halobacteriales archaeon QS_1_68_17]